MYEKQLSFFISSQLIAQLIQMLLNKFKNLLVNKYNRNNQRDNSILKFIFIQWCYFYYFIKVCNNQIFLIAIIILQSSNVRQVDLSDGQIKIDSSEQQRIINIHFTLQIMHLIENTFKLQHHLLMNFIQFKQIQEIELFLRLILLSYRSIIIKGFSKYRKFLNEYVTVFDYLHSLISGYPKEQQKWLDDTLYIHFQTQISKKIHL
ncbi:unnamed protein product [Paramecium sonneborni]|uniref:Uncharacterized protein n=1 Tax=Paramecium sonneborni TaxID=65129 RepID=A0A8S1RV65_9CILI|nr:unnamed protein product [Paramecium sonneborni]